MAFSTAFAPGNIVPTFGRPACSGIAERRREDRCKTWKRSGRCPLDPLWRLVRSPLNDSATLAAEQTREAYQNRLRSQCASETHGSICQKRSRRGKQMGPERRLTPGKHWGDRAWPASPKAASAVAPKVSSIDIQVEKRVWLSILLSR